MFLHRKKSKLNVSLSNNTSLLIWDIAVCMLDKCLFYNKKSSAVHKNDPLPWLNTSTSNYITPFTILTLALR